MLFLIASAAAGAQPAAQPTMGATHSSRQAPHVRIAAQSPTHRWIQTRGLDSLLSMYAIARHLESFPVLLANTDTTPVTLTLTVLGPTSFFLDTASNSQSIQRTIPPASYETVDLWTWFPTGGVYSMIFHATDGVEEDSASIVFDVMELRTAYLLGDSQFTMHGITGTSSEEGITIWNPGSTNLQMTYALSGDAVFSLVTPSPSVLPSGGFDKISIRLLAADPGTYTTMLFVSDGATTDTVIITGDVVRDPFTASSFTVDNAIGGTLLIHTNEQGNGQTAAQVHNIGTTRLTLHASLTGRSWPFTITDTLFDIDPGQVHPVVISCQGVPADGASGLLRFSSGTEDLLVALVIVQDSIIITRALDVKPTLDFDMVDTGATRCLDVTVANHAPRDVAITGLALSGIAPQFTLPDASPRIVPANGSCTIQVCLTPGATQVRLYDVLTIDYVDSLGQQPSGSLTVALIGRSNHGIPSLESSPCLMAWYAVQPTTRIGGMMRFAVEMANISNSTLMITSITLADTTAGCPFGIFSQAPFVLAPAGPLGPTTFELTSLIYEPRAPWSMEGVPDTATLVVNVSSPDPACTTLHFTIEGMPAGGVATGGAPHALFSPARQNQWITIESAGSTTTEEVTFVNNLGIPVTIENVSLATGTHFEILGLPAGLFPLTVEPGAGFPLGITFMSNDAGIWEDELLFQSSYSHIASAIHFRGHAQATTGIDRPSLPGWEFSLAPNPSTGRVHIATSEMRDAQIEIHDIMGRLVAVRHNIAQWNWDGTTTDGHRAAPGTYMVRITGIGPDGVRQTSVKTLLLMR